MNHLRTLPAKFLLLAVVAVPLSALALDYSKSASEYTDAPFSAAETAGISLLTNLGVISGNPDGSFAAARTLNRAEFMKIVIEASGGASVEMQNCFPDVRQQWFASYVCSAKAKDIIAGYPDGLFHPERSVNFAEAVKILVNTYEYDLPVPPANERWAWYREYILAATEKGVLFGVNLDPGALLTRGKMARLAASFIAEGARELAWYKEFEKGVMPSSSSSSMMSSSSSSVSSSASSVSSSSSSNSSSSAGNTLSDFPAHSRFLILGAKTGPIASATFFSTLEPVLVRGVEVELNQKAETIDAMYLVDPKGTQLAQITLDKIEDSTEKTWTATFVGTYEIPKGEERTLGVDIRIKPRDGGGSSERLIQVNTFRITVQGEWSSDMYESAPNTFTFPKHQTAQGRITSVTSAMPSTGALPVGNNQQLAAFTIGGSHVDGAKLLVQNLIFDVSKSAGVTVTNWQLGIPEAGDRINCTVNGSTVSCSGITETMGTITDGPRTLRLFGNVALDQSVAGNPFLQVSLNQAGSTEETGSVQWSDGSANFTWIELGSPVARGPMWQ